MPNQSTKKFFELLFELTAKDLITRYKRTYLGIFWAIINPLLQMLVVGTIFNRFVNIPNYYLFILPGLMAWQFFSQATHRATTSFLNQRQLIHKASFPRESIPLSVVLAEAVNLCITAALLLAMSIIIFHTTLPSIILFILGIIWIISVSGGIALITSTLNVRFRDTSFLYQSLLTMWFYATPIIYSIHAIPTSLQSYLIVNPLAFPFILLHQVSQTDSLPLALFWPNLILSLLIIMLGRMLIKKQQATFTDWL